MSTLLLDEGTGPGPGTTVDPDALGRLIREIAASRAAGLVPALEVAAGGLRELSVDTRLRVAFIGEFSSGKSQVINSLLGDAYLPTGATPTTRVLTEVVYGPTPGVQLTTPDDLVHTIDLERFRQMESLEEYRRVRVTAPVEWLRDFVLVDTPGLGEPQDAAAELVYQELPRADAIVFVLHAQAAFKRSERLFLAERILEQDRSRVLFLLNQTDHLQPAEVEELEAYLRPRIAAIAPRSLLLKYSALDALRGRMNGDRSLVERSNFDAVERQLVTGLAEDHRRLHQANLLLQAGVVLDQSAASIEARLEAHRLSSGEIEARLNRLEQEEARYTARIDLVCDRAGNHIDLITRHLETQLQTLRLRVDEELPALVEGVPAADLRKHMPFYLEHLVKTYLEWQRPAVETRLAELYEQIDRDLSEALSESARSLDLDPGYLASALRTRPASFDRFTQASRMLGVTGIIALLLTQLPLAAAMLAASQVLRLLTHEKREEAEKQQMVEAGKRAMRACLERANDELKRQMDGYKDRVVGAIREEASARMESVTQGLRQAHEDQVSAAAVPVEDLDAALAEIRALRERAGRFQQALTGAG